MTSYADSFMGHKATLQRNLPSEILDEAVCGMVRSERLLAQRCHCQPCYLEFVLTELQILCQCQWAVAIRLIGTVT